jgi:hypothetical protein
MPIVEAICLQDAFDSKNCLYFEKGHKYQIDTDSEVAKLTVRPLSSGKLDKDGNIVAAPLTRKPMPVFQFDKSVVIDRTDVAEGHAVETSVKVTRGYQKKKGYTCSKCGETFKTRTKLAGHQKKHGIGARTLAETASEKDAATEAA